MSTAAYDINSLPLAMWERYRAEDFDESDFPPSIVMEIKRAVIAGARMMQVSMAKAPSPQNGSAVKFRVENGVAIPYTALTYPFDELDKPQLNDDGEIVYSTFVFTEEYRDRVQQAATVQNNKERQKKESNPDYKPKYFSIRKMPDADSDGKTIYRCFRTE